MSEFPRRVTAREREVLEALLAPSITEPYRAQLDALVVTGRCACGCPAIDFDNPLHGQEMDHLVEARIEGSDDTVLLITRGGRLDAIEYGTEADDPPGEFPAAAQLRDVAASPASP